jgi:hypothetical protein
MTHYDLFLAKTLQICISKLGNSKWAKFDYSDIKFIEHENSIIIKTKFPIFINEVQSEDYKINIQ